MAKNLDLAEKVFSLYLEESIHLDDEATVFHLGPSVKNIGVAVFGINDKYFAAGRPLPTQSEVSTQGIASRIVLDQSAYVCPRSEGIVQPSDCDMLIEVSLWKREPI